MGYANKIYWILAIATYSLYFLAFVGVYKSEEQLDLLNFYYRFFIGIAKLFNFREVRQEIQDIIGGESSSITKMADFEVVEVLRSQLSDFKRWAVFCSADGFIDYIATNEDEDQEYDIKLRDFKQDKKYTVITSEDLE